MNQNDGMRYPAIDQLVSKSDSKYRLVLGVSERANQIGYKQAPIFLPNLSEKAIANHEISIAIEEIYQGMIIVRSDQRREE